MRLIGLTELQRSLSYPDIIASMRSALTASFRGECDTPMPMHLGISAEEGEVHIKSSYRRGGKYFVLKIASTFPGNAARGLPTGNGMMLLGSAETGAPVALLQDTGHLTDVRTAAVTAMVVRELERPDPVAGILGTGIQARLTIHMLTQVLNLSRVIVWGRNPERVQALRRDIEQTIPQTEILVANTPDDVSQNTRLIVTCTASRLPLLYADRIRPGTLICAVGADSPGKQELDPAILQRADLILADSRRQCEKLGELQHAPSEWDRAIEIGAFCSGEDGLWPEVRESVLRASSDVEHGPVTVCDCTGLGIEDLYVAEYCYERSAS